MVSSCNSYYIGEEGKRMAALLGRIGEFDFKVENWKQYIERLGHFFDANGITDEGKQRSVLLSVVGPDTYKLLSSLIAPEKPRDKTFQDLVRVLGEHYNPEPSEIVQRYKFHTRSRKQGETITKFVAELRALAQYCNFGTTLSDSLRDRLVCGVNDEHMQRRLLSEKTLTFDKALEL